MTAILSATGITAKHGRNTVLHNVDLSLKAGEIVTIVGPNGSGKSTLLRVLIGALKPTKGKVTRKDGLR
ncbi:MAG: ATP-binding cassette domain-containing protein, partial [Loktanella sp.]|nr:ATP-binding cassette domain-containing protein [Loktanella sp.]